VQVLLARGTKQQTLRTFRVVGIFKKLPGFPQGTDVVTNLSTYVAATGLKQADFFLARATDPSHAGLAKLATALRAGPGAADPLNVETSATALNKDQSSLTALNVHGLLDLNSLYTLLMTGGNTWHCGPGDCTHVSCRGWCSARRRSSVSPGLRRACSWGRVSPT
jgi:hypothetical protein